MIFAMVCIMPGAVYPALSLSTSAVLRDGDATAIDAARTTVRIAEVALSATAVPSDDFNVGANVRANNCVEADAIAATATSAPAADKVTPADDRLSATVSAITFDPMVAAHVALKRARPVLSPAAARFVNCTAAEKAESIERLGAAILRDVHPKGPETIAASIVAKNLHAEILARRPAFDDVSREYMCYLKEYPHEYFCPRTQYAVLQLLLCLHDRNGLQPFDLLTDKFAVVDTA